MGVADWDRIQELFDAALKLDEPGRDALLAAACGGDDALREEVRSLLAAHDQAGSFIQLPATVVEGPSHPAAGVDRMPPAPDAVAAVPMGTRFGSHEVVARLGAGGMGEVYRAHDTKLGRDVAIKILPPQFTTDADRRARLEREARLLATLNHPHIGAIYGLEDREGVLALVLELVEGDTLAERIARGRPDKPAIKVREALSMARQIADALEAAHDKGIVHRDLKPANIKVTPTGTVKVLDFGIAKVSAADALDGVQGPQQTTNVSGTATGAVIGTPAYMSPEQALGQDIDKRTDIWAFGCVLYEMLTGRGVFGGDTPSETTAAVLDRVPDWRALPEATPSGIRRLLQRCLDRDPTRRLHDIADARLEIDDALASPAAETLAVRAAPFQRVIPLAGGARTVVVGLALLAPLLVAAVAWQAWRSRPPDAGPIRSLAVLPFDNLSSDAEQEYLADGITDALITELAGIRSLRVLSRQSVIRYKDSAKPLPEIARELGVDGIVEGAVHRSGSRVRVSAQVVHGPRDEHLWARSFEGAAGDMLALQGEIARAVASGVRVKLTAPEQARFAQAADVDPEAYDLYLRGRYFYNRRAVDDMETVLLKGVSYLQRAVQKDPRFAAAHARLAYCYVTLAYHGLLPPWEATPRIEKYARKALELDPELAEGHLALANSLFFQFDWAGADAEFRKAVESNPGDAHVRQWYAYSLNQLGRFDEALTQGSQGLRIDPFYPYLSTQRGVTLFELGRGEEALAEAREIDSGDPNGYQRRLLLGFLYLRLGREQEALAEFERIEWEEGIARIRALRGDPSGLRALLGRLHEEAQQRYVSPVYFARLHTALGEKDAAFARLEEAYRTKATGVHMLKTNWDFIPLRSDPRWSDLVHRLKLD